MKKQDNNKTILKYALEYHKQGWNVIPIGFKKKPPRDFPWKQYQTKRVTEEELEVWFGNNRIKNLAVVVGEVSGGLTIIDFDSMELYERWKKDHSKLAETLPTVRTSRGTHVYCRSKLDKSISYNNIDILATRKYALLPPSILPDKKTVYEWIIPPNGELPELDSLAWGLDKFTEETEEIEDIEEIEAIYTHIDKVKHIQDLQIKGLNTNILEQINKAIIDTLPKKEGERNKKIFDFCRWLKGIPELAELPAKELKPIVKQWHKEALPVIGTKPFTKTWADFAYGWTRVKYPKGDDTLKKAVTKALNAKDSLPESKEYDSPEVQLLVRVCYELQQLTAPEPFWLSCRSAAGILGVSPTWANKLLQMLVVDEVLKIIEKNTATRATRYEYVAKNKKQ